MFHTLNHVWFFCLHQKHCSSVPCCWATDKVQMHLSQGSEAWQNVLPQLVQMALDPSHWCGVRGAQLQILLRGDRGWGSKIRKDTISGLEGKVKARATSEMSAKGSSFPENSAGLYKSPSADMTPSTSVNNRGYQGNIWKFFLKKFGIKFFFSPRHWKNPQKNSDASQLTFSDKTSCNEQFSKSISKINHRRPGIRAIWGHT